MTTDGDAPMHSGYNIMATIPSFITKRLYVAEHDLSGIIVDANGTALHDGQAVYGAIFVRASGAYFCFSCLFAIRCLVAYKQIAASNGAVQIAPRGLAQYARLHQRVHSPVWACG